MWILYCTGCKTVSLLTLYCSVGCKKNVKSFHGQIAIAALVYLTPNMQSTRGHGSRFCIPAGCVDAFRHSFFPVTIRIWNNLPSDVMSPSLEVFKSRLAGAMVMQRTD